MTKKTTTETPADDVEAQRKVAGADALNALLFRLGGEPVGNGHPDTDVGVIADAIVARVGALEVAAADDVRAEAATAIETLKAETKAAMQKLLEGADAADDAKIDANRARAKAEKQLADFVVAVDVACGCDGTHAPEVVLSLVKRNTDALKEVLDRSARNLTRVGELLEDNTRLHNDNVEARAAQQAAARTLAAVEAQRDVGATVLENIANTDDNRATAELAQHGLDEMRLHPAVIVIAGNMSPEDVEKLKEQWEKVTRGLAPRDEHPALPFPSAPIRRPRRDSKVTLTPAGDRDFARYDAVTESWEDVRWSDITLHDIVAVTSPFTAGLGLHRIDAIDNMASGELWATPVPGEFPKPIALEVLEKVWRGVGEPTGENIRPATAADFAGAVTQAKRVVWWKDEDHLVRDVVVGFVPGGIRLVIGGDVAVDDFIKVHSPLVIEDDGYDDSDRDEADMSPPPAKLRPPRDVHLRSAEDKDVVPGAVLWHRHDVNGDIEWSRSVVKEHWGSTGKYLDENGDKCGIGKNTFIGDASLTFSVDTKSLSVDPPPSTPLDLLGKVVIVLGSTKQKHSALQDLALGVGAVVADGITATSAGVDFAILGANAVVDRMKMPNAALIMEDDFVKLVEGMKQ